MKGKILMHVILDRFEGKYAVCEKYDKSIINIEKDKIPKEAKESDVLSVEYNSIVIDVKETKKRKDYIKNLTRDLWD